MRSLLVFVVGFSMTEAFIGGGLGGGMMGPMCCCMCLVPVPIQAPAPMPAPTPVQSPMLAQRQCCCPCIPVLNIMPQQQPQQQQQQCCCNLVSPVQLQALTTTAPPVGVPDIIRGPCGEIIVPLFNPPLPNQVTGK